MKRLILIFALLVAGTAHASTLYTAPFTVPSGDIFTCTAINKSSSTVSVSIYVIDATNGDQFGPYTSNVEPHKTARVPSAAQGSDYYCKFTTAKGTDIRASASAYSGGRAYVVVPAK